MNQFPNVVVTSKDPFHPFASRLGVSNYQLKWICARYLCNGTKMYENGVQKRYWINLFALVVNAILIISKLYIKVSLSSEQHNFNNIKQHLSKYFAFWTGKNYSFLHIELCVTLNFHKWMGVSVVSARKNFTCLIKKFWKTFKLCYYYNVYIRFRRSFFFGNKKLCFRKLYVQFIYKIDCFEEVLPLNFFLFTEWIYDFLWNKLIICVSALKQPFRARCI